MSAVSVIIEEDPTCCKIEEENDGSAISLETNASEHSTSEDLNNDPVDVCSDDEYDTDIEITDKKIEFDATGRWTYFEACKQFNTTPVSFFVNHMGDSEINMQYRGVGPIGAKAIASALLANTVTLKVNLMENYIGAEGAHAISEMLKDNCYITEIDLAMNFLGVDGCRHICDMLQSNMNLLKLNISRNGFGDTVGNYLADAFKSNFKLQWLDLSGNNLSEKAGCVVGPGINANDACEYLNLSWNQLRRKATHEIALGLRANCTLKSLDLSWNGFSNEGVVALADALKYNNTLIELDISNNRISFDGAAFLAKCLDGNNTLEVLKLDGNPITCKGAMALLTAVHNKSDTAIRELHMKGVFVHDDFIQLYEEVKSSKNVVVHAGFRVPSPLEKLQQYIKTNKSDWLETFSEYDMNNIFRVSAENFEIALQKLGFHFTLEERMSLLAKLQKDSQGRVKYRDILLGFAKEPVITELNAAAY